MFPLFEVIFLICLFALPWQGALWESLPWFLMLSYGICKCGLIWIVISIADSLWSCLVSSPKYRKLTRMFTWTVSYLVLPWVSLLFYYWYVYTQHTGSELFYHWWDNCSIHFEVPCECINYKWVYYCYLYFHTYNAPSFNLISKAMAFHFGGISSLTLNFHLHSYSYCIWKWIMSL
jgi:hypothetical protein